MTTASRSCPRSPSTCRRASRLRSPACRCAPRPTRRPVPAVRTRASDRSWWAPGRARARWTCPARPTSAGPYKGAPFSLVFAVPREGRPDRPRHGRRARRDPRQRPRRPPHRGGGPAADDRRRSAAADAHAHGADRSRELHDQPDLVRGEGGHGRCGFDRRRIGVARRAATRSPTARRSGSRLA